MNTGIIRRRKIIRPSIAAFAVGALVLAACGSDESSEAEPASSAAEPASTNSSATPAAEAEGTLAEVLERGYASYGLEAQYEPFGFRDENNDIVGYDIDVGNEIGERLGIEMRPTDTGWATVIQTMYDGGFDFILGGMTATAERAERVDFGVAYAEQASAILIREDDEIQTQADLDGRIVSAGEGTPSVDMLGDLAEQNSIAYSGEIQQFADDATAFEALSAGRIDAYATSYVSLVPLLNSRPGEFRTIEFRPEGWPDFFAAMAFRQEDDSLREAIDAQLLAMKADGTLAELQMKWFGTEMTTPDTAPEV